MKQAPGIGTVLNAIIVALVLEYLLPYLPVFDNIILKVGQATAGVLITGFGGALYLIANLGPGPRDGLMTGLQKLTNLPIAWVRSGLELMVIAVGWSLGGAVGFRTVLFAVGIGPTIATSMYGLKNRLCRRRRQRLKPQRGGNRLDAKNWLATFIRQIRNLNGRSFGLKICCL